MKRDENGLIPETEAQRDARYNEGEYKAEHRQELDEIDRRLRDNLDAQMDAATDLANLYKQSLERLNIQPSVIAFIERYADAKARVILIRESQERCGFIERARG